MILIKVPAINGLNKTNGCEKAPDEIFDALREIFSNEDKKVIDISSLNIDNIIVDNSNIEESNKKIYEKAKELTDEKAIFVGGDHSITYSLVKGFSEKKKNIGLIIFDAHADCCPDFNLPTHEDLLLALVKEKIVNPENIILIGSRNYFRDEIDFLEKNKIKIFDMKQIFDQGIQKIVHDIMEEARKFDSLYLSIDIDVVDPAFAPGTGYIEPAGLSSRELIYFIQKLKLLRNLDAVDITEVNPDKDINEITIKLGAKIIAEFLK